MIVTVEKYSNDSTASIPLALDESIREEKFQRGGSCDSVGLGAGLTYGVNLVRL
jgi:3-oxoacyl-[acyl-carrier-protein] synthase-3